MCVSLAANICCCLCWVGVLSPDGFCFPLYFLGGYGGCVLPGMEFYWDPAKCDHGKFWVKNVSSIGGLILRNGEELDGRLRGFTSRRKAGCSTGISLAAWEQKQGSDERP